MYLRTKMKFLGHGFQKLAHEQDRQTDRQTDAAKHITTAAFASVNNIRNKCYIAAGTQNKCC